MTTAITCPHCKKTFEPTENAWNEIVQQVKGAEFEEVVTDRVDRVTQDLRVQISTLENDYNHVKAETELRAKNYYDKQIAELEKENAKLSGDVKEAQQKQELAIRDEQAKYQIMLSKKDDEIKSHQEEIKRLKDYQSSLSNKELGEAFEQYCQAEFDKIRPIFGEHRTELLKDTKVVNNTKGDFIFREYLEDGTELLSIMFEMKDEFDKSVNKKKNEEHFKQVDTNRNNKNCEYAVLVSTLEKENEFYNQGIVDVSLKSGYKKMFAIRPQFFIPFIRLLHDMAQNNAKDKMELAAQKRAEVDVVNFLENFKNAKKIATDHYTHAIDNHQKAIKQVDDAISALQEIRHLLETSDNQFGYVVKNFENVLSIKELTKGNPTMKKKFDEAETSNLLPSQDDIEIE